MPRRLKWLSSIQKLSNGALSKSCIVVSQEWLWLQTKTEHYWLPRGESLSGQREREKDDGRGRLEIPTWKHFSMVIAHASALLVLFPKLQFSGHRETLLLYHQVKIYWANLLPEARTWADFHSLHYRKSRILMAAFLASWWFNSASIWLAFELLNTSCSITSSLQNANADQSWTISVGTHSLCGLRCPLK